MKHYSWLAVLRDGTVLERWNDDGSENKPPPEGVAEFHLLPVPAAYARGARPVSFFLRDNERLVYTVRVHADMVSVGGRQPVPVPGILDPVIVVGVEKRPYNGSAPMIVYTFVLPDGLIEVGTERYRPTRYERNFHEHPLRFYEVWPEATIPGFPDEEARWPGEYDKPIIVPDPLPDPAKVDPPLLEGFARNSKEFESDAIVVDPACD